MQGQSSGWQLLREDPQTLSPTWAGAMGVVASALGRHGVSISALSQKGSTEGNLPVPVVAMTRKARSADLDAALSEIKASGVIGEDPVKLRVL